MDTRKITSISVRFTKEEKSALSTTLDVLDEIVEVMSVNFIDRIDDLCSKEEIEDWTCILSDLIANNGVEIQAEEY